MTFDIKPQDKRPLERAQFELHPDLIQRLAAFAKSLSDSDPSYVLGQILEQALPKEKAAQLRAKKPAQKPLKQVA